MLKRFILFSVGILLMLGVVRIVTIWQAPPTARAAQLDPTLRTVVVVAPGEPRPVLSGADVAVDLETGTLPTGVQRATVLTDKDCAADDQGVSHCLNDLEIGRTQVAIRHHHTMMDEPCFSPTEELNVVDVTTYRTLWPTAQ